MARMRLGFNVSHDQSLGYFRGGLFSGGWGEIICDDNQAILNVDRTSYDITHCQLDKLGDLGSQRDKRKEAFFQINMDDGRKLVGYTSRLQDFRNFMIQWRLMKKNVKAEMKEAGKIKGARKRTTTEISQALQQLKNLYDLELITQEEYEEKRQELVDQL